jgi:hypothetical protein
MRRSLTMSKATRYVTQHQLDLICETTGEFVGKVVKPLEKRIAELEHNCLRDGGVYHPAKAYSPGMVVQFANALWVAKCDTVGVKPGTSSNWRLILKRDGK